MKGIINYYGYTVTFLISFVSSRSIFCSVLWISVTRLHHKIVRSKETRNGFVSSV